MIVDLNTCLSSSQIQGLLSRFGKISYVGKLITFVVVDAVPVEVLPTLAALPQVAMVEWQVPMEIIDDVSSRAVQARASNTYSPNTAQNASFTGTGVNVAILDTGVNDGHEAFTKSITGGTIKKFVAGFDATNPSDPEDGTTNPIDDDGHGTHVAGIAIGFSTPGRTCRTPDDGSSPTDCAGVGADAKLVDIKVCKKDSKGRTICPSVAQGLDWLGINAEKFNVRVANMSIGSCTNDDGTSALAQQVNYVVSLGVAFAISHGNAATSTCPTPVGAQQTGSPGSASLAITVGGTNDQGTVARTDDANFSNFFRGPRIDFNPLTPNLLALKPDLTAPGQNVFSANFSALTGYISKTGTSMAAPHVAG
ncbi:MAG: S8 family serine peptidase, partial [Arenimonas sp.]